MIDDPTEPLPTLVRSDLKGIVAWLNDPTMRYQEKADVGAFYHADTDEAELSLGFYDFLDKMTDGDGIEVDDGYLTKMNEKLITYLLDTSTKKEINDTMDDLIETFEDDDFQEDFERRGKEIIVQ